MDKQSEGSSRSTILVVDDTPDNLTLMSGLLKDYYRVKLANNGAKALSIAQSDNPPDLILLDIMMPEMDGYEVCRRLKDDPLTESLPVIFLTAKSEVADEQYGFSLGAVDYITKPISPPIVLSRIKTHLALYDQARHLENLVQERTQALQETRLEIVRRLGRAAEYKDNETGLHVIRMSWFSRFLAERAGQPAAWCELLFTAAPMHDIGKIGIPDRVLLKPGKLDEEEWEIMKRHAEYGAEILGDHDSTLLKMAKEIAICHHEKWDGSGYPNGLSGEEIPLSARIVAIADVYDALCSERPYKQPWPEEKVIQLLKDEAGKHFDPSLIPLFIECLPQIREIQQSYRESMHE